MAQHEQKIRQGPYLRSGLAWHFQNYLGTSLSRQGDFFQAASLIKKRTTWEGL